MTLVRMEMREDYSPDLKRKLVKEVMRVMVEN